MTWQLHGRADAHSGRGMVPYAAAFAALRIALGLYWLYEQHWKLPPDFGLHDSRGLMFAFQQSIQHPTLHAYRTFLQDVVVPQFHLFVLRTADSASTDGSCRAVPPRDLEQLP